MQKRLYFDKPAGVVMRGTQYLMLRCAFVPREKKDRERDDKKDRYV